MQGQTHRSAPTLYLHRRYVMLIKEEDRKVLKDLFEKELKEPVKLVMFTQKKSSLIVPETVTVPCEWCEQTEMMVQEVAELSEKITADIHDFVGEAELAKQYGIDKIPAIAVVGEKDY